MLSVFLEETLGVFPRDTPITLALDESAFGTGTNVTFLA